jgi:hypothetical protein
MITFLFLVVKRNPRLCRKLDLLLARWRPPSVLVWFVLPLNGMDTFSSEDIGVIDLAGHALEIRALRIDGYSNFTPGNHWGTTLERSKPTQQSPGEK